MLPGRWRFSVRRAVLTLAALRVESHGETLQGTTAQQA